MHSLVLVSIYLRDGETALWLKSFLFKHKNRSPNPQNVHKVVYLEAVFPGWDWRQGQGIPGSSQAGQPGMHGGKQPETLSPNKVEGEEQCLRLSSDFYM